MQTKQPATCTMLGTQSQTCTTAHSLLPQQTKQTGTISCTSLSTQSSSTHSLLPPQAKNQTNFITSTPSTGTSHVKKRNIKKEKMDDNMHHCNLCNKKYNHYASLYKHKKSAHKETAAGHIKCLETGCTYTCHYIQQLRNHLEGHHQLKMNTDELNFQSSECNLFFTSMEINANKLDV